MLRTWAIFLSSCFCTVYAADPTADKVTNLPGLTFQINYGLYSGYLNAGKGGDWKMHYWLVESKTNPTTDPVLVWFNGGPGCSSFGGAFEEMGPFYVAADGKTLFENKYSWNYRANMLFLESPIGVGFSYDTKDPKFADANDDQSRDMNYEALTDFFNSYTQYKNRSFFLSGESYAGVYIPMLTARLGQGISDGTFPNPNFQGSAIGNGYMDVKKLYNSLVLWSAYHGRVSMQEWDFLKANCTQDVGQLNDMDTYNYYSYLATNSSLDFSSDNSTCGDLIFRLVSLPDRMDPYNYYQDCFDPTWQADWAKKTGGANHRQYAAKTRRIRRNAEKTPEIRAQYPSLAKSFNYDSSDPFFGYPCWNDAGLWIWANNPDVQKALNIDAAWMKTGLTWEDCNDPIYWQYNMTWTNQYSFFKDFLAVNKNPNFRFLIYNGDVDTVCNYLGDAWFVKEVAKQNGMTSNDRTEWWFSGQSAGYTQRYTDPTKGILIDIMTVKGAGHFVPTDRPGAARQMITNFIIAPLNEQLDYNSTMYVDTMPTLSPILDDGMDTQTKIAQTNAFLLTFVIACMNLIF
ncbi:unnamed protein product, partial [Mesorhabditis belari]|uniref:Carboxypeptidase n=1 Tax=Mesorhabditis belari TaxID=2138241 RepID=A0AAF3EU66_9BILA